jgi:hypothetical protein
LRLGSTSSTANDILSGTNSTVPTTFTHTFLATSPNLWIYLRNSAAGTTTWDNVSVKEVTFDQPDGTLTLFEHPNNIPRVEWDAQRNRLGLLVEEARTNLVTDSQDFSGWTNVNAPLTPNAVEAPDGTITATKLVANATNGQHRIDFLSTYSAGTYTFSVFAKAGEYNFLELRLAGDGVYVDIRDGSVAGTSAGITTHYQDVGNGWKKIAITHSAGANDTARINVIETSGVRSFAGDGTSGIYIWGAQLEAGSFPTSYIKNQGTSGGVTRSADVASIPVADFGFNADAGALVAEYNPFSVSSTARGVFELSSGTGDDKLHSRASVDKHWLVRSGGVTQASIDLGSATEGQQNKISGAYKLNDFAASLNGSAVTTDTSGSVPSGIQELIIGSFFDGSNLNGHIKTHERSARRLNIIGTKHDRRDYRRRPED